MRTMPQTTEPRRMVMMPAITRMTAMIQRSVLMDDTVPRPERPPLTISRHAQQRRKQMGVTEHQIALTVYECEMSYPGSIKYPPGRTCYQRGALVVVMDNADNEVITVLWHRKEGRDV